MRGVSSSKRYLFKNAGIIAILSGTGVASGLILDALILATYGIGYQTDALLTALTVPLLLSGIFSIQAPKILIPAFSEYFNRSDRANAWRLLSNLVTTGASILVGVCLAGMALSGVIIPVQIIGLDSKSIALAVLLSRILFGLVLCQGLASILQSVLYAQHRYLISSSGKLISNAVTIIVILLGGHFGVPLVAAGMVVGSFVQLAVLAVAVSMSGYQYRWVLEPTDTKLREISRSLRYPLAGHVFGEAGTILQNVLGSFLGSGSLTVIRYASRIVQAVAGVLLGSIVQVTLPLVSNHTATNDLRAQRKTLLESVHLFTIVGVPLCIWLFFTAEPLLVLLFERGEFARADAALIAFIIRLMVPDILLNRLVSISQTIFYANLDTRTPLISTGIVTFAHTIFAVLLVYLLGVIGLPIAVCLASFSGAIYMMLRLQHTFGPIGWRDERGFACRLSAACIVASIGFIVGNSLTMFPTASHLMTKFLDFAVPTVFGLGSFVTAAFLFRLVDTRLFLPTERPA